ncbi:immediate early response gene 2 protein-like [Pristis pectinata]|uniref:immediate early response gene 2 protein-like n=1 Tax=Pristis pectinata TaxID=685728 RepID=UPI00223DFB5F|nr:immediate early response gene 2 protein-like [Pristis pectinata]
MDMKAEAQRVMAVALGKMYSCRLQRGGARLHRSLLLSLVLRGAQDVYLGLRAARQPGREEPAATGMEVESGVRGSDPAPAAESPAQGIELMDCSAQPLASAESPAQSIEAAGRLDSAECIESGGVSGQCIQSGECNQPGTPGQDNVAEPAPPEGQEVPEHQQLVPRTDRGRKRRKGCPEPEGLPSKRARLEEEEEEGEETTPSTHILASSHGTGLQVKVKEQPVPQGQMWRDRVLGEHLSMWVRPIVAY